VIEIIKDVIAFIIVLISIPIMIICLLCLTGYRWASNIADYLGKMEGELSDLYRD